MRAPPNNPATNLTLAQVHDHFTQWRQTKSKGGKIPKHLWQEVFSLSGRYRHSNILRTLGISTAQHRQMKARLMNEFDKPPSTDFVDVTPMVSHAKSVSQPLVTPPRQITIDYQRYDGAVLSVKGLSLTELHHLVTDFYGRS